MPPNKWNYFIPKRERDLFHLAKSIKICLPSILVFPVDLHNSHLPLRGGCDCSQSIQNRVLNGLVASCVFSMNFPLFLEVVFKALFTRVIREWPRAYNVRPLPPRVAKENEEGKERFHARSDPLQVQVFRLGREKRWRPSPPPPSHIPYLRDL